MFSNLTLVDVVMASLLVIVLQYTLIPNSISALHPEDGGSRHFCDLQSVICTDLNH